MSADPENRIDLQPHTVECGTLFSTAKPAGNGFIKKIELEDGLRIYIWDCIFDEKAFIHFADIENESPYDNSLIYYLSFGVFSLYGQLSPEISIGKLWNTIFTSGRHHEILVINQLMPVKCLDIRFSKKWVEYQSGEIINYFKNQKFLQKNIRKRNFFFETYGGLEKKMIDDIFNAGAGVDVKPIFLKARLVTIIKEFISKVAKRDFAKLPVDNHDFEITKIESRLLASLQGPLPLVKKLAVEFCLSESTLKRDFKKTYGMSILQFFMQKKMDYAYKLVNDRNGNVSEIACLLGYEKVSRFISMFKKHHGISPGALLKSK